MSFLRKNWSVIFQAKKSEFAVDLFRFLSLSSRFAILNTVG
jgi:hypothetical protein